MFALPFLHALRFSGDDALEFIHAQLTADVYSARRDHWHAAAWCDAAGRCLTVLWFCADDHGKVDLVLPADQAETIARRFQPYMLRRAVALTILPHVAAGGGLAIAHDPQRAIEVRQTPAARDDAQAVTWQLSDYRLGMPWLAPATAARHLPQSLGLEALNGVDYGKGCYPGQEVIARVHYRGRPPRRMSRIRITSAAGLAAGTPINAPDGTSIGELLWSVQRAETWGLAVVARDSQPGDACAAGGHAAVLMGDAVGRDWP